MMDYNRKRRWGTVVIVFIAAVLAAGYAIGDYFVDYALKRGNETDPLAPPAACVNILDKSREMPEEPAVPTEEWRMTMPDGRNVVAVSYRPAKTGHRWDYAEVYLKQGYHVLSPDLCAAGESDGQYITMGVKESEEIAKWAAKVKESDGDAEIVLHGISMGAATVMLAAGRYEMPGLAAVVEDCSYTSAYEMFANQLGFIFGLPEFPIMTCVDIVSGIKTGVKVSDAAPIKAVPDIKVPIMFIHGTADKLVPFPMMEKLYNACPAPKRKFVVEGAGHGDAMTVAGKEYWEAVFSFLDDCLGALSISR